MGYPIQICIHSMMGVHPHFPKHETVTVSDPLKQVRVQARVLGLEGGPVSAQGPVDWGKGDVATTA